MTETQKYALIGALFGLAFPIVATIVRISNSDLPFQLTSVVYVQSTDSLLWIIDTAPLFLGFFFDFSLWTQDNLQQLYDKLSKRENEL